jgi:hypothetical protein
MGDTAILLVGILTFAITAVTFWYCLPSADGKTYRFANTEWEPYVGVAFCSAVALSFTMILSSLINMFGS